MHSNRLLKKPVEEHTPGSRTSAVKSEDKFVQVSLYMIRTERSLVGAEQPPFHESRDTVDSRENFVRVHAGALDGCASMNVVIPRRQRVGGQSVGENLGTWFYMSQEEGAQRVSLSVGDDLDAAAAETFWLELLYGHSNEHLSGSPSPALSGASTTKHRFIHLHITGKSRAFGMPNGTTKSVKHCPSGLVGAKPHKAVERFGRHSVFRCRHVPSRSKPYGEGCFRPMEDCPGRCRNPAPALFAPPPTIIHAPSCSARTVWAGNAVRPTKPVQVIEASGIIRKPAEEISIVLGVVLSRLRPEPRSSRCHRGMLASPHSSGYPTILLPKKAAKYGPSRRICSRFPLSPTGS